MMVPRRFALHGFWKVEFLHLLLLESLINISNAWVADRFKDGFGHFYIVNGFAMSSLDAYETIVVQSLCLCRIRCQVVPKCHSASAVPIGDGQVECRLSLKPADLADVAGRPELYGESGAFHFLQTNASAWTAPEVDGLMYTTLLSAWGDGKQACKDITPSHSFAICNSNEQLEVMKKYADQGDLNIWLRYRVEDGEPAFGPVASPIPFSEAGLDAEYLSELDLKVECLRIILKKSGDSYKFVCGVDNEQRTTLCQRNPLHINW
ncbi:uncharacterized protein LOC135221512 [Macrobrachium nipponense]|uniref:uncharacterized protein LOC135221512 n=1 Tax=Macrobrachium nipponense TaxID=159736 RepID=UPI0030C841D6